jgi:hypothetical protein
MTYIRNNTKSITEKKYHDLDHDDEESEGESEQKSTKKSISDNNSPKNKNLFEESKQEESPSMGFQR